MERPTMSGAVSAYLHLAYDLYALDHNAELQDKLRSLLFLSDLVKFAKEKPLISENEMNLRLAIEFVEATKKEEQPSADNSEQPEASAH